MVLRQFLWQLDEDCANEQDGLLDVYVVMSHVDIQTTVCLLDALSPVSV